MEDPTIKNIFYLIYLSIAVLTIINANDFFHNMKKSIYNCLDF